MPAEGVELEIEEVKKETDMAFLVLIEGDKYWLPKSQIYEGKDELEEGAASVEVTVSKWWAEKEGLE